MLAQLAPLALPLLFLGGPSLQGAPPVVPQDQTAASPDALYRQREDPASAKRAADLWAEHARTDYASAWKLARVCYWIGTHGPKAGRHDALTRGETAAHWAIGLAPDQPEGHFWLAANLGALAEAGSVFAGLKYRGEIKTELQHVIDIHADWEDGSAECALARWYFEVPGWIGGSHSKAKALLQSVLDKHPDSYVALSFLADIYIDEKKPAEARPLLQHVLDLPIDDDWAPDDREFKREARTKLDELR